MSVAMSDVDGAERRIGIPPFKTTAEPPRAFFEVGTSAGRGGDDEWVIWEIAAILDGRGAPIDWHVVWDESEY